VAPRPRARTVAAVVVAVDGREVHGPTPLRDTSVEVTAGGRADIEVVAGPRAQAGTRESYDVAFVADNPGVWMDHCHQLRHAADGLVAHLMYEGVDTPYLVGEPAANSPE
jgi:FtsP/CotA-like multicopper oxidase with cupredoxin domain